jgi:hypothetical protein
MDCLDLGQCGKNLSSARFVARSERYALIGRTPSCERLRSDKPGAGAGRVGRQQFGDAAERRLKLPYPPTTRSFAQTDFTGYNRSLGGCGPLNTAHCVRHPFVDNTFVPLIDIVVQNKLKLARTASYTRLWRNRGIPHDHQ